MCGVIDFFPICPSQVSFIDNGSILGTTVMCLQCCCCLVGYVVTTACESLRRCVNRKVNTRWERCKTRKDRAAVSSLNETISLHLRVTHCLLCKSRRKPRDFAFLNIDDIFVQTTFFTFLVKLLTNKSVLYFRAQYRLLVKTLFINLYFMKYESHKLLV